MPCISPGNLFCYQYFYKSIGKVGINFLDGFHKVKEWGGIFFEKVLARKCLLKLRVAHQVAQKSKHPLFPE